MMTMLSWLAVACTLIGTFCLAKKMKSSWVLYSLGSVLWIIYGVACNQWALVTVNSVLIIANLYGLYAWSKQPEKT
jgi:nicotinamide riboside transporter PnuC